MLPDTKNVSMLSQDMFTQIRDFRSSQRAGPANGFVMSICTGDLPSLVRVSGVTATALICVGAGLHLHVGRGLCRRLPPLSPSAPLRTPMFSRILAIYGSWKGSMIRASRFVAMNRNRSRTRTILAVHGRESLHSPRRTHWGHEPMEWQMADSP